MNSAIVWVLILNLGGLYASNVEIVFKSVYDCEQARKNVYENHKQNKHSECQPKKAKDYK